MLYNEIKKFDRKVFFVYGGIDTQTREENSSGITRKRKKDHN